MQQMLCIRRIFSNTEEDFAARFVRTLGCEVIARNMRVHGAEIDLLCKDRKTREYILFEVKRRMAQKHALFPPVSRDQLRRLKKAAERIQSSADRLLAIRVCLLLVDLRQGSVELIPDVVSAL